MTVQYDAATMALLALLPAVLIKLGERGLLTHRDVTEIYDAALLKLEAGEASKSPHGQERSVAARAILESALRAWGVPPE